VVADVKSLHRIASNLRRKRFDAGAVRLSSPKLSFKLDSRRELPVSFAVYELHESNFLVEEFMLLANMSVANFISEAMPDFAPLRRHPPPKKSMMEKLAVWTRENLGKELKYGTSRELQASLEDLRAHRGELQSSAVEMLLTKPMQEALYFCTADVPETEWFHYGLCVPRYTHFTSPIRRYVDVLVHRVLQIVIEERGHDGQKRKQGGGVVSADSNVRMAILGTLSGSELRETLENCNQKKMASKNVQIASQELFLRLLLGPKWNVFDAVVTEVGKDKFTVHSPALCLNKDFYYDRMERQGAVCETDYEQRRIRLIIDSSEDQLNGEDSKEQDSSVASENQNSEQNSEENKPKLTKRQKKRNRRRSLKKAGKGSAEDIKATIAIDTEGHRVCDLSEEGYTVELGLFSEVKVLGRSDENLRCDLDIRILLDRP